MQEERDFFLYPKISLFVKKGGDVCSERDVTQEVSCEQT